MKHFFDDTDLLGVLLVGVGMVGIHDHCRIFQLTLFIELQKKLQILVMIVGDAVAVLVYRTTQNGMCQRISGSLHFPVTVNEGMSMLRRNYGIQHNGKITTGILHSCRNIHATDHQTMLLVFDRTGSDRNIGKDIGKITPVFRIKHLICCRKACLLNGTHMQLTDGYQTCQHIRFFLRVRLMEKSLVAFTGRSRFICINTRDQKKTVAYLVLNFCQSSHIITHRILIICRAGSDDHQKTIGLSCKYIFDLLISLCFYASDLFCDRILKANLLRSRKFCHKFKAHNHSPLYLKILVTVHPFTGTDQNTLQCSDF